MRDAANTGPKDLSERASAISQTLHAAIMRSLGQGVLGRQIDDLIEASHVINALEDERMQLRKQGAAARVTPPTADSSRSSGETQGDTGGVRGRGGEGFPPSAPSSVDSPPVTADGVLLSDARAHAEAVALSARALQSAVNRAAQAGLAVHVNTYVRFDIVSAFGQLTAQEWAVETKVHLPL